jgi:hypothetical protein
MTEGEMPPSALTYVSARNSCATLRVTDEAQEERAWRAWLSLRTSWHEAGHALAGILVGQPLEIVSTRPGEQFSGVAH